MEDHNAPTAGTWTPDQPLRADAGAEQLEARAYKLRYPLFSASINRTLESSSFAEPWVKVAREFAAACVAEAKAGVPTDAADKVLDETRDAHLRLVAWLQGDFSAYQLAPIEIVEPYSATIIPFDEARFRLDVHKMLYARNALSGKTFVAGKGFIRASALSGEPK